ncbi:hypothetical protein EON67_06825 [archaeon]|nr:MAG: hypothetical protein EON67_06825 [archaeon]
MSLCCLAHAVAPALCTCSFANMPTKVVSKPAALPELPAGHVLGKWTLGKRLGAGGFGYVHEATHPALPGQVFALKVAVLKEASRGSKPAKDTHGAVMIHKEVNTYRNVVGRHASRHFARLAPRDAYEENAQYRWLVMDKLGDSLAQKAANKKVPFSTVANIGLQVVRAAAHMRTQYVCACNPEDNTAPHLFRCCRLTLWRLFTKSRTSLWMCPRATCCLVRPVVRRVTCACACARVHESVCCPPAVTDVAGAPPTSMKAAPGAERERVLA